MHTGSLHQKKKKKKSFSLWSCGEEEQRTQDRSSSDHQNLSSTPPPPEVVRSNGKNSAAYSATLPTKQWAPQHTQNPTHPIKNDGAQVLGVR